MAALQDAITAAQTDPASARQLLGVFTAFCRRRPFVEATCRELVRAGVPRSSFPIGKRSPPTRERSVAVGKGSFDDARPFESIGPSFSSKNGATDPIRADRR